MKCSGVPCTHNCEWKKCSPSSVSSYSSGWIFMIAVVELGSTSMIYLPLSFSASVSKSNSGFRDFVLANKDFFELHSSVLFQGILWHVHHFIVFFLYFSLPLFTCALDWLLGHWPSLLCPLGFCWLLWTEPGLLIMYQQHP